MIKDLIKRQRVISEDQMSEIMHVGNLIEAVEDHSNFNTEDFNKIKEFGQRVQVLDLFLMAFVVIGSCLCSLSVSHKIFQNFTDSSMIMNSEELNLRRLNSVCTRILW